MIRLPITVAALLVCFSASIHAQTSAPASQPTTRRVAVVPPGFKIVTEGKRAAWCEPADEKWVRATLPKIAPATRPSTMPSDILAHAAANREKLSRTIVADLGIEPSAVAQFFDDKLVPAIRQLDALDAPMFYLTLSRTRLIALLRDGKWDDPRFHYNRAADDVTVTRGIALNLDRTADDVVIPATYDAGADTTARADALSHAVTENEEMLITAVADRSIVLTQIAFIEFVGSSVITPMKPADDQQWFALGLVGALGAKYSADVTGIPRAEILRQMTREYPRMPVKSASIDLLHPTPAIDLRKEYVPYYADAMRRKSTTIIAAWLDRAGEAGLRKTLDAIKKDPPKDGPALVAIIKQTTGQDLTKELAKR